MTTEVETEIKLAASPAMLEALREHPLLAADERTSQLMTTYFDTADRRLRAAGASLRLRANGKRREQTVKLPARTGSIVVRGEWTVAAIGKAPDIGKFAAEPRAAIERLLAGEAVAPVAETRIDRTVRQIAQRAATIEVAFDRGTIRAGTCAAAVSELELELVTGSLADLLDLALALPLGPDLQWSAASKSGRALALADGTAPTAAHATPAGVSRDMDAGCGFQAIAWSCLSHLLANAPLVVAQGDPEALHQSRVAIRRLRAAIGLFGPLFEHDAQSEVLGAELKAAANALGPARDAHVLLERLAAAPIDNASDPADLLAHIDGVAARATASARTMLAGPPFQTLLFQTALWLERGSWRDDRPDSRVRQPLPHFAAQALRKRRRKVRRIGTDPAAMTVEQRHALRIAVKKLRYAADFLAPLYPADGAGKVQRRFYALAAKVQDWLGELHDVDVLAAGREALFAGLDPIDAARLSAQLDALVPALAKPHDKLLKRAGRAMAKLDQARAWWKADL